MKLTNPQKELLKYVGEGGNAVPEYRPAQKLLSLGLVVFQRVGVGRYLMLTDAGRAALAKMEAGE